MPILETVVANPVTQPGVGRTPDVSLNARIVGRGLEDLSRVGLQIAEAEAASKTRQASAAAERELYDLADKWQNSTDYDNAESAYATGANEILQRYRGELTGTFYQDAFDESAGAFNDRMAHAVRSGVRTKRIDGAKARLDAELGDRTYNFAKLWNDPDAREQQRLQYFGSVDIQLASGLITESEGVNYKQSFDAAASQATDTQIHQARVHNRVLEVMASAPDKKTAITMADASDADIAQDVFNRVSARFGSQEAGNEAAVRQMKDNTFPVLEQAFFKGFQDGPGEHDIVPPGPEAAWTVLDELVASGQVLPNQKPIFDAHIKAMSARQDLADEPKFAREYDRLVQMRDLAATGDGAARKEWLAQELPTIRLRYPNYRTQIDALITDQRNMLDGFEPAATETKRANELYAEMFDVRLTAGGEAKLPRDRERLAQFRLAYEIGYQEDSKVVGRRLTREEELKLATRLLRPVEGQERYQFQLPPRRAPLPGSRPGTGTPPPARPARPDQPPPARVSPQPSHAMPYTNLSDNKDLALQATAELDKRNELISEESVLAEMNRLRGAARE